MKKLFLIVLAVAGIAAALWMSTPEKTIETSGNTGIEPVWALTSTHKSVDMPSSRDTAVTVIPEAVPERPVMDRTAEIPAKAYRFGHAVTVLENKLELELGRKAAYDVTLDNRDGEWRLLCGTPMEADGQVFDYTKSRLKSSYEKGYVEGSFCALFKDKGLEQELVAFDVGSTDNYVADWMEKLDLPSGLVK